MRKEGKLYSFEDQKWDAEMRLELERKRKKELVGGGGGGGGEGNEGMREVRQLVKEAKLSQKQKVSH